MICSAERFGIKSAVMNTIHSYINSPVILGTVHKDLRRARAEHHSYLDRGRRGQSSPSCQSSRAG